MTAITGNTILGVIIKGASTVILVVILPFSVWATLTLFELKEKMAVVGKVQEQIAINTAKLHSQEMVLVEIQSWKAIGPRFTSLDAEDRSAAGASDGNIEVIILQP